jgi:hypothetical protein
VGTGTTATHEGASNRKQGMPQSGRGGGDCIYQRPTLTAAGFFEKVTARLSWDHLRR